MLRTVQVTGKVKQIKRVSTTRVEILITTPVGYVHTTDMITLGECAGEVAKQVSAQLSVGDNITLEGTLEPPTSGINQVKVKAVHYNITRNKQPIQEAIQFRTGELA